MSTADSTKPRLAADALNSLDLKCALVGAGVRYPQAVYNTVADWARLEPPSNPYAYNCLILSGEVVNKLKKQFLSMMGTGW